MLRRLALASAVVAVAAGGVAIAASDRQSASDLDYVVVEAGDTYYGIVAAEGLSCNGSELRAANGRNPLDPGTIVFIPPYCTVTSTTTTTTVEPSTTTSSTTTTTIPPATTTTTMAVPSTTPTVPPAPIAAFVETFDTPASMDSLVVQVHNMIGAVNAPMSASGEGGNLPVTFNGDHDEACGGALTTRTLVEDHTPDTHVYHCLGHFMSAVNTTGYVVAAFTPNDGTGTAVVFDETVDRICWDQNLTNLGGRKWTQLAVISDDRYEANGRTLIYVNPDNAGNAGNSPIGAADDFIFSGQFNAVTFFQGSSKVLENFGSADITVTNRMARYQTCAIDNGDGTVTRTQERPNGFSTVTGPGAFPAGDRVFILSDDSYNPDKFNVDKPNESPQFYGIENPYTWHWDNIIIDEG